MSSSSSSHQIPADDFEKMQGLNGIVFDFTVSKHKPAKRYAVYNTITNALNDAPKDRQKKFYIHVEGGIYEEYVEVGQHLTNIVLIGDKSSTKKTVVQYNKNVSKQYGTQDTGTIRVLGDRFVAMHISFINTTKDLGPAAAAVVTANRAAFYNCSFHGYQDTLYAQSGTQFYRDCSIYGTMDFICGAAAAVFQNCNMYAVKRTTDPWTIEFTAQQRVSQAEEPPSGFVIQNCNLTVAPGLQSHMAECKAHLGRPWSIYSTVVVMESFLDSIILPEGWGAWTNVPVDKERVTYREFRNKGPGAKTAQRIKWPNGGYKDVSDYPDDIKKYTVGEFINKDGWLAGTHIPHYDGFANNIHHPA